MRREPAWAASRSTSSGSCSRGSRIFLSHLVLGVGLALTIIGIPFAYQHLKFGMLALAPFGKQLQR